MRLTQRDTYRAGDAYFICDRCSQRWRRSQMLTEWDNLRVCPPCLDPRPPQMAPPEVYPEGLPFPDARPPQDNADRLGDDSYLVPVSGGFTVSNGQIIAGAPLGRASPQPIAVDTIPPGETGPSVLADDVSLRTGPVFPPSVVP